MTTLKATVLATLLLFTAFALGCVGTSSPGLANSDTAINADTEPPPDSDATPTPDSDATPISDGDTLSTPGPDTSDVADTQPVPDNSTEADLAVVPDQTTDAPVGVGQCGPLPLLKPTDVPTQPGQHSRELMVGETARRYLIHIPTGYDGTSAVPLVLFFHGGGGSAVATASQRKDFVNAANANGFILVFPDGYGVPGKTGHTWNSTHCCGPALRCDIDDIAFIDTLVKTLKAGLKIDAARVYATGFSNGGMISHKIGAELPGVFAAIAPAGGTVGGKTTPDDPLVTITPSGPISVMLIHGVNDGNVAFNGGYGTKGDKERYDIAFKDSAALWAKHNQCDPTPTVTEQTTNNGKVITHTYQNCANGVSVIAVAAEGLAHQWPTKSNTGGYDGTAAILQFFAKHPKTAQTD